MTSITRELLQRRAEHNEKMLINLEEISLHQQEIIKIENLDVHCRHLKILLLQNNIIDKMENLSKLKELEYLNLALNNITKIEGIEGCESIQKLDMTVNFVDVDTLVESVECMSKCQFLRELYMTGNPCTDWKGCRDFIIAQVFSLQMVDGKDIHPSERIQAIQRLPILYEELKYQIEQKKIKDEQKNHENMIKQELLKDKGLEEKTEYDKHEVTYYTAESRKEMYLQMSKEKEDKDKRINPQKYEVKEETKQFTKEGKIRQCDEGGYKPILNQWEDATMVTFTMKVPKFLDSSLVLIELNPKYVSVRVKGKLTQLRLDDDHEIQVENSTIQRSQLTGELVIKMPKVNPDYKIQKVFDRQKDQKIQKDTKELKDKTDSSQKDKQEREQFMQKYESQALHKKTFDQTTFDEIPDLE